MAEERDVGPREFSSLLDQLQRTGCSIGVIGDVPHEAYRRLTTKTLSYDFNRREVIGFVGDEAEAADWFDYLDNSARGVDTRLLRLDASPRISSSNTAAAPWTGVGPNQDTFDTPEPFLTAIEEELVAYRSHDIPAPLLSVFPVGYIADELGWDRVYEFIVDTSLLVNEMNGAAFYHMDRGVRNSNIESTMDLFDALAILRKQRDTDGSNIKQKWQIRSHLLGAETNITTKWFDLPAHDQ